VLSGILEDPSAIANQARFKGSTVEASGPLRLPKANTPGDDVPRPGHVGWGGFE